MIQSYRSFDGEVLDVTNMCIIPGLIDAHTHPVFDGDRVHEFAMKVRNMSPLNKCYHTCKYTHDSCVVGRSNLHGGPQGRRGDQFYGGAHQEGY